MPPVGLGREPDFVVLFMTYVSKIYSTARQRAQVSAAEGNRTEHIRKSKIEATSDHLSCAHYFRVIICRLWPIRIQENWCPSEVQKSYFLVSIEN